MPIIVAEAVAPVASWRPPEALTYHRSLPLPPYTSLVGTLGAALGLALPDAYRFVAERRLRLGVGGWHEGRARDLWKFQKLESIAEGKEIKSDVLLRELWMDVRLVFVVETDDAADTEVVAAALDKPAFPLTAGTSDALLKLMAVRIEQTPHQSTRHLGYSLVFSELPPRYELAVDLAKVPLSRVIRAPTVERLPTGFVFDHDGRRRLAGRDLVTFVADPIELDDDVEPVSGYPVAPHSRPLRESPTFSTLEGLQPWIIPVHRYDFLPMPAVTSSTVPSPSDRTPRRGKKGSPTGDT
jgi:CRISPR-associated protein Cas5t